MISLAVEKACNKCGETKPLGAFHRKSRARDGRQPTCKVCDSARHAATSKQKYAEMRADPERHASAKKVQREWRRRTNYGLTQREVEELDARGVCDVCGRTAEQVGANGRSGERLHIDHNHMTGKVRGVLCKHCNSALGLAGDDPERLIALASYLIERS